MMPQEDGHQDGKPYLGARSIIRNIMLGAGMSEWLPGCEEFGEFWRQYQRLKCKPGLNPYEVVGHRPDGTAETNLDCWVAYDLKPRLKAAIAKLRSHGSN